MATTPNRVTVQIKGLGTYQTTAEGLDLMIMKYLPSSISQLRSVIVNLEPERTSEELANLRTITECLMVLAELNGYATN
jgi:hypothetical protein